MDERYAFLGGMGTGIFILTVALLMANPKGVGSTAAHTELCPTILEHAPTYADSLAVIQKHEGCWEFVHPPAP